MVTNTTNPKLQKREELEHRYFELQMCDHWSSEDYRYAEELREQLKRIGETDGK